MGEQDEREAMHEALDSELRAAVGVGEGLPDGAATLVTVSTMPEAASRMWGSTSLVRATGPR